MAYKTEKITGLNIGAPEEIRITRPHLICVYNIHSENVKTHGKEIKSATKSVNHHKRLQIHLNQLSKMSSLEINT